MPARVLQAALVYVNTLMVQDVLADDDWATALTEADRRGLTPLFWTHVAPVRRGQARHEQPARARRAGRRARLIRRPAPARDPPPGFPGDYGPLNAIARQGQPRPRPHQLAGHAARGRLPGDHHGPRLGPDPHDQPGRGYRRRVTRQLNIQESRHLLARKIFHGQRGELRQADREGQDKSCSARSAWSSTP